MWKTVTLEARGAIANPIASYRGGCHPKRVTRGPVLHRQRAAEMAMAASATVLIAPAAKRDRIIEMPLPSFVGLQ
jgi:hypothetical protein